MPLTKREKFEKQYHSPGFVYYTHTRRCVVPGCATHAKMDACHSRGGKRWQDIFPGCHVHHMEQHTGVKTFERKYHLDLVAEADAHVATWMEMSDDERQWWEEEAVAHGYKWPR